MKREMMWVLLAVLAPAAALAQCIPCMHLGGQVVCPPGITPGATSVEFVMGGIRWSDGNISMGTDLMTFTGCPPPTPPVMAPVPPMPMPSAPAPAPAPVPTPTAPAETPAPSAPPRMTSQDQAALTQETPQGRPGADRPGQQPAPGGDAANEVREIFTETPEGGPKPAIDTGGDTLPPLDAAPETGGQPPIDDDEDAGLPDPEAGSPAPPFTPREQQRLDETKEQLDEAARLEADAERYRELARQARRRADEYEALEDPRFDADAERQRQQAQEFEDKANGFQERADQLEQQAADTIESVTVDAAVRQAAADAAARAAAAAAAEPPKPEPRAETPSPAAAAPADDDPGGGRPAAEPATSLANVLQDKAVDAALDAAVDKVGGALGAIGPRGASGVPGAADIYKLYKLGLFAESALAKSRIYNRILIMLQDIISNPRTPERKLRKAKELFEKFRKDGVIGTAGEGLKDLAT